MLDFLDGNSPYHILVLSILLYLLACDRRIERRERVMKLAPLMEKILFPFSTVGAAALLNIIIAVYTEFSLPVSYIAIGILKLPVNQVNMIWDMGMVSMLFLGTGFDIFYEVPASKESKVLKIVVYIIAVGCILYGGEQFIAMIVHLFTR